MLYTRLFAVTLVLFSAPLLAGEQLSGWPLNTLDPGADNVKTAYQSQCAAWAEAGRLEAEKYDAFMASCQRDISQVWPVGFEQGGGGDEG